MGINFILVFSVCETTSRTAFRRCKGCILLIAWKGHYSIQHATGGSFYLPLALWPIPGHGIPQHDFAITLTGHTTLGRPPWMSDHPDEETATDTQHSQEPDIHVHALARLKPAFPASERPQTARPLGSAWTVTADSHIPRHSHAVPLPCRSVKGFHCVYPIWFSECSRVWFTHAKPFPCRSPAMPRICRSESDLSKPRQGYGMVCVN
jgi:hypothetical protein